MFQQNICNGVFLLGKNIPNTFNTKIGGTAYSIASATFEARTNSTLNMGVPQSPSTISSKFLSNSARVYCRNNSYPFNGEYQWVAIDIDGNADASGTTNLESNSSSVTINDNLGTTNKVGIIYKDSATLGASGWNAAIYTADWFCAVRNSVSGYMCGIESRSTWADYTELSNTTTSTFENNSTTFAARSSYYLFAGDYTYKIYKI